MNKELRAFDEFADDIISSNNNLLKGELDILLMQYLFDSQELEKFNNNDISNDNTSETFLVA